MATVEHARCCSWSSEYLASGFSALSLRNIDHLCGSAFTIYQGGGARGRQVTIGLGIGASGGSQLHTCCAVASCCASSAVAVSAIFHAVVCCTAWGTPSGHTALLASIAITAVRGGSCPAACHASLHASIVPHTVAELHAPLENGASKFNNASRVISSMSIPVPPLPASSAATSASCATLSLVSILFVALARSASQSVLRVPKIVYPVLRCYY